MKLPSLIPIKYFTAAGAALLLVSFNMANPPEEGVYTPPQEIVVEPEPEIEEEREPVLYLPRGFQPIITTILESPEVTEVKDLVTEQIIPALTSGDTTSLAVFLSKEISATFEANELEEALNAAVAEFGTIVSMRLLGEPNITGDYADQNIELVTTKNVFRYQMFLKKENGTWKVMGTEPLP